MKQAITDKEVTKVRFYIERGTKDNVFAYFPNEKYYGNMGELEAARYRFDLRTNTSYSHIGQHSACHPDYVKGCKKATPDQYNDLKTELESIGYNLQIL